MKEIEISLHDLKFIRDGYKNLAENGADNMRAVGKGVDCKVECKTYKELYEHYVKSLDIAIKALEKQIPQTLFENKFNKMHIGDTVNGICPVCFTDFVCITPKYYKEEGYGYCKQCGQKLDWG